MKTNEATIECARCTREIFYDTRIYDAKELEGAFCSEECAYPEKEENDDD